MQPNEINEKLKKLTDRFGDTRVYGILGKVQKRLGRDAIDEEVLSELEKALKQGELNHRKVMMVLTVIMGIGIGSLADFATSFVTEGYPFSGLVVGLALGILGSREYAK